MHATIHPPVLSILDYQVPLAPSAGRAAPSSPRSAACRVALRRGSASCCVAHRRRGDRGRSSRIPPGWEVFGTTPSFEWGLMIVGYVFFAIMTSGLCLASSLGTVFGIERFRPVREAPRDPRGPVA